MEKYRAIPKGYMTIGEVAKKMNTTVRTLQYYDKEGLLSPSAESDGGRRLYTDKDIIKLHQIQSMKYLGFSLDDIKTRLVSLETPADVAKALSSQAEAIREKIASLTEALDAIEILKNETIQMETVNWARYADIVTIVQMGLDNYWAVKGFDDKIWEHIKSSFDVESGKAFYERMKQLFDQANELQESGVSPESEQGQSIGKMMTDMIMEFTGGDMSLFPEMMKFTEKQDGWDKEFKEKYTLMIIIYSSRWEHTLQISDIIHLRRQIYD
jgi:DNA-binding transcriptional MerR regulator